MQVAWLLAARPDGVRADQVADALGKSISTAYNLLASLCEEGVATHGGGVYRLAPGFRQQVATGAAAPRPALHDLSGVVADLLARTHKRSYLALIRAGELQIVLERGLQGMPKLPGLKPRVADTAHAVALGKVVLALARPAVVERYVRYSGLRAFTDRTITDPERLADELATVRERGFAVEREETYPDFCCVAAPIRDRHGRFVAALGISMTRRAFDEEHESLAETLLEVARIAGESVPAGAPVRAPEPVASRRFQASAETPVVLDPTDSARLACARGSTVP
jgi:acetyl-CoA synthetase